MFIMNSIISILGIGVIVSMFFIVLNGKEIKVTLQKKYYIHFYILIVLTMIVIVCYSGWLFVRISNLEELSYTTGRDYGQSVNIFVGTYRLGIGMLLGKWQKHEG